MQCQVERFCRYQLKSKDFWFGFIHTMIPPINREQYFTTQGCLKIPQVVCQHFIQIEEVTFEHYSNNFIVTFFNQFLFGKFTDNFKNLNFVIVKFERG